MWRTRSEEKDQRAALIGLLFGRRGLQRLAEADALDHRFCCFPIVPPPQKRHLRLFFFWVSDSLVYGSGHVLARVTKSCVSHHGTLAQPAAVVRLKPVEYLVCIHSLYLRLVQRNRDESGTFRCLRADFPQGSGRSNADESNRLRQNLSGHKFGHSGGRRETTGSGKLG